MPHSHPLPKNKKRWEWGWDRGGGPRSLWVGTGWLMLIFSVTCFPIVFAEGVRILGLEVFFSSIATEMFAHTPREPKIFESFKEQICFP